MELDVLARTERFVAVDKPSGWLSVPSRWGARDPRPVAGLVLQETLGARLWPVHRLDEEASGVLLFALDARAHSEAGRWFEHGMVVKTYEALSQPPSPGSPIPAAGDQPPWRSRLLRGKKRAYEAEHGKPSETRATLHGAATWRGRDVLRWTLRPVTGRPHQLRFELFKRGMPIVGDTLYGSEIPFEEGAIALRCTSLELPPEPARALGAPLRIAAREAFAT